MMRECCANAFLNEWNSLNKQIVTSVTEDKWLSGHT